MGFVTRGERLAALLAAPLTITIAAVVLSLPRPARAAAPAAPSAAPSAILPAELAGAGEVLPVSRGRKRLVVIPNRPIDGALVFGAYTVNDYDAGWITSRSRRSRRGDTASQSAEGKRSFAFALHGGAAPLLAQCDERAAAARTCAPGEPVPAAAPDHSLRCTLEGAGGPFELSVVNGRGELVGVDGERFGVSALGGAASRWEPPRAATGLLLRAPSGHPLAALDFGGNGRVVLERDLQSPQRELLAAATAALLLADLDRW